MVADPIGSLRRRGELELDSEGGLRFHGAAAQLFFWLDAQFEQLALDTGARPLPAPGAISRETLDLAGYFESFADVAIPVAVGGAAFLPPAACYHAYPVVQGQRLDAPRLFTLAVTCGRREQRAEDDVGRLRLFRMREAVFVGAPEWVDARRNEWMARATTFASSIGLACAMEPATDSFFGGMGRGRQLLQQLKKLKYELRMDAGSAGRLAVASFNLHESFFTRRFNVGLADGTLTASGCAAFGIERWTLACLAQLGPARVEILVGGGVPRSTMNT